MHKLFRALTIVLVVSTIIGSADAQRRHGARPTESGGPLLTEQAAYDVKHYDITAQIFPESQSISGSTIIKARIVSPTRLFVIDLDTPYEVSEISILEKSKGKSGAAAARRLKFKRKGGKLWIDLPGTRQPGETVRIRVSYSGKPRVARNPPWVGGFMWSKTPSGKDWIVIACQNDGADVWFPIKDHPSDEADSVSLHITVPRGLYVATVGKLSRVHRSRGQTVTFHWDMSNPINNYNVVLNIAPYKIVESTYRSVSGDTFPIIFYALPENVVKAKAIVDETKVFLDYYEKYLGPFPYRSEKLGIVETPHLGMEHSTIIAYGNKYKKDGRGFDWLMLHELGHEWWGNMVTASDWRDYWIHEGFQAFMDEFWIEHTKGKEAYIKRMNARFKATRNKQTLAPRKPKFAYEVYFAAPNYTSSDGDIYSKGAAVLHTLRYLIGDEAFFKALRRMAYPTKAMEKISSGAQNRFATTDDFKQIAEEESGMDLDWFFEVYFRQPKLPKLVADFASASDKQQVVLRWKTPDNLPFPMPLDVKIDGKTRRVQIIGTTRLEIRNADIKIDEDNWVLKAIDKRIEKAK